jgi:GNAT superfamily N-acetyltransferase
MSLKWSHESRPRWDSGKQRIVGGAPEGALDIDYPQDADLPGDWFAAADGDRIVGYGWMDSTWGGDTEILLAVDPDSQGKGIGSFVMDRLEQEAANRGVNYVYNTVRDAHPDRDAVHDWLMVRGYRGNERDASLRKHVAVADVQAAPEVASAGASPAKAQAAFPPGREDSGGYVNIENHQY